jgi:hypothetical protein
MNELSIQASGVPLLSIRGRNNVLAFIAGAVVAGTAIYFYQKNRNAQKQTS